MKRASVHHPFGYGTYEAILEFAFWIFDFGLQTFVESETKSKIGNLKSKIPSMRRSFLSMTVFFVVVLFVRHRLRQIDH